MRTTCKDDKAHRTIGETRGSISVCLAKISHKDVKIRRCLMRQKLASRVQSSLDTVSTTCGSGWVRSQLGPTNDLVSLARLAHPPATAGGTDCVQARRLTSKCAAAVSSSVMRPRVTPPQTRPRLARREVNLRSGIAPRLRQRRPPPRNPPPPPLEKPPPPREPPMLPLLRLRL